MFKVLDVSKRHTGCTRCNYQGCVWLREKHPIMGHWLWTVQLFIKNTIKRYYKFKRDLTDFDYTKISAVEVENIDTTDYPDFCDAFISYAEYKGKPMTEAQLERLNDNSSYVYDYVIAKVF